MSIYLRQLFASVNQGSQPPAIADTVQGKERLHHGFLIALTQLKQRMRVGSPGSLLVERVRVDLIPRYRPRRDVLATGLSDTSARIATLAPDKSSFSRFQVSGWDQVLKTIEDRATIVILAPTGSGKTEVFVLPVVDVVCSTFRHHPRAQERFLMIYPRVELLRDQLSRILSAVHFAQQRYFDGKAVVRIGLQFSGIAASLAKTLDNRDVFNQDIFQKVRTCPICRQGELMHRRGSSGEGSFLSCTNPTCSGEWLVSLSKEEHRKRKPHLMVMTAEALDRFYLDPRFEGYLKEFTGIVLDEAHLYHGVYGAHIHRLFQRLDRLRGNRALARIASSATIADPRRFVAKLMHGDESADVRQHDASTDPMDHNGDEYAYFVQATNDLRRGITRQNPALIQTIMLLGHGVLKDGERIIAFVDSIDHTQRMRKKITNAEHDRQLWKFRVRPDEIHYDGDDCKQTSPQLCRVFHVGECWRGGHSTLCWHDIPRLRTRPLEIEAISSVHAGDFMQGDVIIATPTLEVGVDDDRIAATVHYQAPISGVHGFIQRRGRAGRGMSADAVTVMVLGQTPTEQYYFYRRHRLLHGKYMLPLNPDNPVIQRTHQILEAARNEVAARFVRAGSKHIQYPLHEWLIEHLRSCQLLGQLYPQDLACLKPGSTLKGILSSWINREKPSLSDRLQLRALMRELREQAPQFDDLITAVDQALRSAELYSQGQIGHPEVRKAFKSLDAAVGSHVYDETGNPHTTFTKYQMQIRSLWDALGQPGDLRSRFAEQLYDFFDALAELLEHDGWRLNDPSETIKITLRALYYLHLGEAERSDASCPANPQVLVPNNYYGEARLVVVEARVSNERYEPKKYPTSNSFLSSILIPYALTSRYYGSEFLATIHANPVGEVQFQPDGTPTVRLRLVGQGIHRDNYLEAQKVEVRALLPSDEGLDLVRMCPVCYRLHSFNRITPCHGNRAPQVVKVYPEAITQPSYSLDGTPQPFSRNFSLAERVNAFMLVSGSEVRFYEAVKAANGDGYIINNNVNAREFHALYETPLGYGMPTKGITWGLASLINELLADRTLREQVESISIGGQPQQLTENMILETAGAMLAKAIAALAGVNADHVAMATDPGRRELCVWENIEGGAGIAEVFVNSLRTSPVDVFRELLTSAVCAVNIAEARPNASLAELEQELRARWHFAPDDSQLQDLLNDIQAERQSIASGGDSHRETCSATDGCPACVNTNGRGKGREALTSRYVAEALLERMVQRVTRGELEDLMAEATRSGLTPPQAITPEDGSGFLHVLVL